MVRAPGSSAFAEQSLAGLVATPNNTGFTQNFSEKEFYAIGLISSRLVTNGAVGNLTNLSVADTPSHFLDYFYFQ